MIVYRLSKSKYASSLTGFGAAKWGGRWNSPGIAMIYTGQSRALCTAEIAVHTPMGDLPEAYFLVTIIIPGRSLQVLSPDHLPLDWKSVPPSQSTRRIGDTFIKQGKSLALKVPSVVVPGEFNILINPNHARVKEVNIESIEPFEFDTRLFIR